MRGLRNKSKLDKILPFIKSKKLDVACFQVTYFTKEFESTLKAAWKDYQLHCFSDSNISRGDSIFIDSKLNFDISSSHFSIDGRRLLVNVTINNEMFTIVNLYAPNHCPSRVDFFKNVANGLNSIRRQKQI